MSDGKRLRWVRAACALAAASAAPAVLAEPFYLIVAGLGGEPSYAGEFAQQAEALAAAARRTVGDETRVVVMTGDAVSRETLRKAFDGLAQKVNPADSVIVFLVGHGSYDGESYKFNIPGPDVDGDELGGWLAAVPARSQLIVDATSASGAVLEKWAADGRTVITATRSGAERNATRFGEQWAEALSSPEADTNKDEVITAQEAFDFASRMVADSYESEGALATEHPQIKGEAAERFMVARLTERTQRTPQIEALYSRLGDVEGQIELLRQRRDQMDSSEYLDELQPLLVELATVQRQIDDAEARGEQTDDTQNETQNETRNGTRTAPPEQPTAPAPESRPPRPAAPPPPPPIAPPEQRLEPPALDLGVPEAGVGLNDGNAGRNGGAGDGSDEAADEVTGR